MRQKNTQTGKTQLDVLMEYFKKHPNRDIPHPNIVDWATREWKKQTGGVFRDPDRGIRRLHQDGYLIKVRKGVYRYNPKAVKRRELEDFTPTQKASILKGDKYKSVICGMGRKEGFELHVDHIKAKDSGGRAIIENGQTLCSHHNFMKKNFKQTETGKRMFIHLYNLAKSENNKKLMNFCVGILHVYKKYNINGHITWKK